VIDKVRTMSTAAAKQGTTEVGRYTLITLYIFILIFLFLLCRKWCYFILNYSNFMCVAAALRVKLALVISIVDVLTVM